jgi:hypothetical protein
MRKLSNPRDYLSCSAPYRIPILRKSGKFCELYSNAADPRPVKTGPFLLYPDPSCTTNILLDLFDKKQCCELCKKKQCHI